MVDTTDKIFDDHYVFFDNIKIHDGLFRLTVPKQLADGAGWTAGDKVKIWIRKEKKSEIEIKELDKEE